MQRGHGRETQRVRIQERKIGRRKSSLRVQLSVLSMDELEDTLHTDEYS